MPQFRNLPMSKLALAVIAMTAVVVASNFLVQFPVHGMLGPLNMADLLTWGAFTYPIAFLVTDLTNRRFGPETARIVVFAGFIVAVVLSVWLATPRIALASGCAFLVAQLLDVTVFDRLRQATWWKAPIASSVVGSAVDTVLFFSIAFAAAFSSVLGGHDPFAVESAPFLGVIAADMPRWISWAAGDFCVKLLVASALLGPYRILIAFVAPLHTSRAA